MKKKWLFMFAALLSLTASAQENIYGFKVKNAEEKEVSLDAYKGKVLLIVNTATRCGFTPQYNELQAIYAKYREQGFDILDFPCNQFGEQAPGSNEEIHEFCTLNFNIQFEQFDKIEVNGDAEIPLYTYLKKMQPFKGFDLNDKRGKFMDEMLKKKDARYAEKSDIKWNFTKFLVDAEGKVVARFEPTASMEEVEKAIAALLPNKR